MSDAPHPSAPGPFDVLLTRADGAIDLVMGRRREGWAKLDVSADGFWNSFLALPACLPALLVTWLAHGRFIVGQGSEVSPGALVASLALIEAAIWLVTIGLFVALAGPLKLTDRLVPAVIAVNWASVPIAYARAVPASIALLAGMGPGIAFVTLVIEVLILVAYWRLLGAALERGVPMVLGMFLGTLVIGYALADAGHGLFGLVPPAPDPSSPIS